MPRPTSRPSLAEWTIALVPFALGATVCNLLAEASNDVNHYRAAYFARLAPVLATAAFGPYLDTRGAPRGQAWRLLWTFGGLAYLVPFYLTWFVLFRGDAGRVFAEQGGVITSVNLLITVWWTFDAAAACIRPGLLRGAMAVQRWSIQGLVTLAFFFAAVINREGIVRWLGLGMVATLLVCALQGRIGHAGRAGGAERQSA